MALLNDNECPSKFSGTVLFSSYPLFLQLVDYFILFAKSEESVQGWLFF